MLMRVALCIALVVATSNGADYYTSRSRHDSNPIEPYRPNRQNVTHMIHSAGYSAKEYQVVTNDGYILDLIRIPCGIKKSPYEEVAPLKRTVQEDDENEYRSNERQWNEKTSEEERDEYQSGNYASECVSGEHPIAPRRKGVVLLMTGYMSNAEDFVIDGDYQGLAFILADFGFDVFLGNVRGSKYGLKHTTMESSEPAFWRFGIHDIGTKDVPAIVDKVIEVTGKNKLHYIGHMVGSTVFYVMTSSKPEYNNKIKSMIDLGNVAYMEDATNKVIKKVSEHLHHSGWIVQNMGEHKFTPSRELLRESEEDCVRLHGEGSELLAMCHNKFFLVSGYNSEKINKSSMLSLVWRSESTTSTKQVIDLALMKKTGIFGRCLIVPRGPSQCVMHEYDLKKVTVPVSLFSTLTDSLCPFKGVQKLMQKLPNVKETALTGYGNNLDLLHGKYVNYVVVPRIITMLVSQSF